MASISSSAAPVRLFDMCFIAPVIIVLVQKTFAHSTSTCRRWRLLYWHENACDNAALAAIRAFGGFVAEQTGGGAPNVDCR